MCSPRLMLPTQPSSRADPDQIDSIDRMSGHLRARPDPEQLQHGSRYVLKPRMDLMNFPAGEEHAWNTGRINAMIANPGIGVVLDFLLRDTAESSLPGASISRA